MKKYILTIDQGTTSTRAILFDKMANTVGMYQMEFTQICLKSGYVEHNAEEIYETVLECIKNVINNSHIKAEEIDSIAITNQRETTVMFDLDGHPLANAICWQSRQSQEICEKLIEEGYEDIIFKKTGLHINPYFSASKIIYLLNNNPEAKKLYDKGQALFGTIDTYILYRLTGGKSFMTDATNASRTMLYNIHTDSYDDELLDIFGIKKSALPNVMNSSDNFGYAVIDGEQIPICSMIGDQQASLFGHCAFDKGDIKNTYGTGCFMLLNTGSSPVMSQKGLLTTIASKIDGKITYALEGSVFIAGAAIKWLRDSLKIINESRETYDRALKSKNDDLVLVPAFVGMGTPYWDNDVRGAMFGITLDTNQDDIVKATLDSIAFESLDVFEVMASEAHLNSLSLSVDGGASANDYLLQFQADIMQSVIKRPRQVETTALGACFLAGLYTGFFKDYDELKKLNQTQKMFYPILSSDDVKKKYNRWKLAVESCRVFKPSN